MRNRMGHKLGRDVVELVVSHTPEVTPDNSDIVGLGGMGEGIVLVKQYTLLREVREGRLREDMRL